MDQNGYFPDLFSSQIIYFLTINEVLRKTKCASYCILSHNIATPGMPGVPRGGGGGSLCNIVTHQTAAVAVLASLGCPGGGDHCVILYNISQERTPCLYVQMTFSFPFSSQKESQRNFLDKNLIFSLKWSLQTSIPFPPLASL